MAVVPRPPDIRHFVEVDSTNRVAADLARGGAGPDLVVVADHQTAGRGRRGRRWEAPPGTSLLVSVVLGPPAGDGTVALATVACALAAADAVGAVAGFEPALKWPNDLVVGDRKLAGVLAELVPTDRGPSVVVGLGLNMRSAPPGLPAPAVTVEEVAGRPIHGPTLLGAFVSALGAMAVDLDGPGRAAVIEGYRRRCVTIGRAVRVELPGGTAIEGVAQGVDDDGRLLVATGPSAHRVDAGDVVHVRAGTPGPEGRRAQREDESR